MLIMIQRIPWPNLCDVPVSFAGNLNRVASIEGVIDVSVVASEFLQLAKKVLGFGCRGRLPMGNAGPRPPINPC